MSYPAPAPPYYPNLQPPQSCCPAPACESPCHDTPQPCNPAHIQPYPTPTCSTGSGVYVYPTAHIDVAHHINPPPVTSGYYQTQPNYQADIQRIQPKNPELQKNMDRLCKVVFGVAISCAVCFVLAIIVFFVLLIVSFGKISSVESNDFLHHGQNCSYGETWSECPSSCENTCVDPYATSMDEAYKNANPPPTYNVAVGIHEHYQNSANPVSEHTQTTTIPVAAIFIPQSQASNLCVVQESTSSTTRIGGEFCLIMRKENYFFVPV
ncbi:hypothetical protein DdX_06117 [Ditylenchus destructor]|uniref:Uncharacterized protein n=1 Tax=Ditylenchus destructor TaxID=166010 RepID=A0AAD4NA62_9BILA|nr:hypothetical protein DdX_06117 [Ditylenchus destructor]